MRPKPQKREELFGTEELLAQILVPASTANLGPGFDCLSASVDLYNEVKVYFLPSSCQGPCEISHAIFDESSIKNEERKLVHAEDDMTVMGITDCLGLLGIVPFTSCLRQSDLLSAEDINKAMASIRTVIDNIDPLAIEFPGGHIHLETSARIPFSRGLGSSTAAYQAGLLAALVVVLGERYPLLSDPTEEHQEPTYPDSSLQKPIQDVLAYLCIKKEGHPDNAVACAYGGCPAMLLDQGHTESTASLKGLSSAPSTYPLATPCYPITLGPALIAKAIIPDRKTSTSVAREAMPASYPKDVVATQLRALFTLRFGLEQGSIDLVKAAFDAEGLHVPFRNDLNPHLERLISFLDERREKRIAVTLSGSGSTLLALADRRVRLEFDQIIDHFTSSFEADTIMKCESRDVRLGVPGIGFLWQRKS